MQAVYRILSADGNLSLRDLSFETALSARQLERLFSQNLGLSPKKLAELVRYQLLWEQKKRGSLSTETQGLSTLPAGSTILRAAAGKPS